MNLLVLLLTIIMFHAALFCVGILGKEIHNLIVMRINEKKCIEVGERYVLREWLCKRIKLNGKS